MSSRGANMGSRITAALERSLQKCSLTNIITSNSSSSSDSHLNLNSHISLPYYWQQCLDLKTGEIYYINWRNGMKAKEDPRLFNTDSEDSFYCYYDDSDDDSEESSTESTTTNNNNNKMFEEEEEKGLIINKEEDEVLVVAGCKRCLMYFMVPKHVEDCPKCSTTGQLLHFHHPLSK